MGGTRNHFNPKLTDEYLLSDLWINTLKHTVTNLDLLEFISLSSTNQHFAMGGRWCAEIVRECQVYMTPSYEVSSAVEV